MPKILNEPEQNMLREVERLLTQEGYSAVTIRAVAQGCGVGVGTVYNYYPSKEALLAEYLLVDWRACIARIEAVSAASDGAEPVAAAIRQELLQYAAAHSTIFQEEAARSAFVGSFSQYHGLLRSQLAAPLRRFCGSDFAADFAAEALLTWTVAGKEFCELWGLLSPVFNQP